jgi:hypothetical protein
MVRKGMTHEQAIGEAARVIKQSHFNYRNSNRVRFMNGNRLVDPLTFRIRLQRLRQRVAQRLHVADEFL